MTNKTAIGNKAAVFILLGQSNAAGHWTYMPEEDKILTPMKNVFGLSRELNQSYDKDALYWSGYVSGGMNLAETHDHTFSVANCIAKQWQTAIDGGQSLPDLYIVQIAIGSQGVTSKHMWYPEKERILIPGELGTANIALFSYTLHFLSMLKESLAARGKTEISFRIDWRGGEQDAFADRSELETSLKSIYKTLFNGFYEAIGEKVPTYLHRLLCKDIYEKYYSELEAPDKMRFINGVFDKLAAEEEPVEVFDMSKCPHFDANALGYGIFGEDLIHYTRESNEWAASEIMKYFTSI